MNGDIPVTVWECVHCDAQFYLIIEDEPKYCPNCLKRGLMKFLDDVENDSWRPPDYE